MEKKAIIALKEDATSLIGSILQKDQINNKLINIEKQCRYND